MIDVSVVIVNWNAGAWLRRAVTSARAAGVARSVEIIVVDNASADGSASELVLGADLRVIENRDNVGFARASNQGLRASRGRYALLLNPDAELRPGALRALTAFMDAEARAGAAGPALVNPDGTLQPSGGSFPSLRGLLALHPALGRLLPPPDDHLRRRDFNEVAEVDEVSGACMIVRRAAIEQAGMLDEGFFLYFEDVDWCLRLKRAGWKVFYVPQARVTHQWRSRTDPTPDARLHHYRSQRYYVRKHFGKGWFLVLGALGVAVHGGLLAKAGVRCLLDPTPSRRREVAGYRQLLRACRGR